MSLGHGVPKVGRPVAVTPQYRQIDSASGELGLERSLEHAIVIVDRAHPAEVAVVGRDLFEPLVRDAAAAGDVPQEGDHVVLAFWPAEPCRQDGVVVRFDHASTSGSSSSRMRRPV